MKIQLISDLHLEFWKMGWSGKCLTMKHDILRPADVLVVAGDLDCGRRNTLHSLEFLATQYETVFYVSGNHEYYNGLSIRGFDNDNFDVLLPENVFHLRPGVIVENRGVVFFGGTLWTNFDESPAAEKLAQKYINDFRRIPDANKMKDVFYEHLEWIQDTYAAKSSKQKVIVTHFLPAMACVSPKYRDGDMVTSYLNHYFANSLDRWVAGLEDTTWLFGHTHDAVDVTIGTTRCLARPVGYPGEHPGPYEPLVLEL